STARIDDQGTFTGLKDGKVNTGWSRIVPTNRNLLFYHQGNGGISTARIDDQGTFTGLKNGKVNAGWTHITPA
ncbi:hypothetical protein, partial [Nonomuraea zeae]